MSMAVAKAWLKSGKSMQTSARHWRCGLILIPAEPFSTQPAGHASIAVQPGGGRWNRVWQGICEQLETSSDPQFALSDTQTFSIGAPFFKCKGRKQKIEKEKKARKEAAPAETQEHGEDAEFPEDDDEELLEAFFFEIVYTYMSSEPSEACDFQVVNFFTIIMNLNLVCS